MKFWLKHILPRRLFARALLIFITPVLLAQIVAIFIFYDRHWSTVSNRLAFAIAGEIALVIDTIEHQSDPLYLEDYFTAVRKTTDLTVTYQPNVTADLPNRPAPTWSRRFMLDKALKERIARPFSIDLHSAEESILIKIQLDQGLLIIHSPERRLFTPTTYIFLLWMIGSSLVFLVIALIFLRNQIRPIRRLAEAADNFGKGRDIVTFRPEGAVEVRQAAIAFTLMRDRLRRQIEQRTTMLAGVSHDLRTPLTRMKLQLAMLPDRQVAAELERDVTDMQVMIDAYLAFAKGEDGEAAIPTDLIPILKDLGQQLGADRCDYNLPKKLPLTVRPHAIKRAFSNLIANAAKYAPHLWIGAKAEEDMVYIWVEDNGPGIPEDQYEAVFRPFLRLEESRNSTTGGVGLGLTIARDIIRFHGGDVQLSKSPKGGIRVNIRIPH
jgi:two-component system, OmpR family, osmolarity sensor histidine kinase EnvZ